MTSLPARGALRAATSAAKLTQEAQAGELRDKIFGPTIFVRGVIEVSNFCRQNCDYCGMRRDNRELGRFRLELEALRETIRGGLPGIITDLNLQTGEDTVGVRELILPLVRILKQETDLGISVCLGTLDHRLYDELREAGASYYIIKIETGNREHYGKIHAPGTFERRLEAIRYLASTGWAVSSGFIVGLPGQTEAHIDETLNLLGELPLAGASVSPFIPGEQTPFAGQPTADFEKTLECIARLRLRNPGYIIPAVSALNIVKSDGYQRALRAGANLATINLTPPANRGDYLLYKRSRFIMHEQRVRDAIEAAGYGVSQVSIAETLQQRIAS